MKKKINWNEVGWSLFDGAFLTAITYYLLGLWGFISFPLVLNHWDIIAITLTYMWIYLALNGNKFYVIVAVLALITLGYAVIVVGTHSTALPFVVGWYVLVLIVWLIRGKTKYKQKDLESGEANKDKDPDIV